MDKGATAVPADSIERKTTRGRWYTVGVLIVVATLAGIDRNILSVLGEPIKNEFQLSDGQLGLLVGLIFAVSYSLAAIPAGMLVDRFPRTRFLAIIVAIWSSFTALSSFAWSAPSLVAGRIVVASAEAGAFPASLSIIGDLFHRRERAGATGMFFAGTALSLMLCFAVGGYIASHYGWRMALLAAGIPGLFVSALCLTILEPVRGACEDDPRTLQKAPSLGSTLRFAVTNPLAIYIAIGSATGVIASSGLTVFIASFFIRSHNLSLSDAGFLSAFVLGGASLMGGPLGGHIADVLCRKRENAGMYLLMVTMIFAIPAGLVGMSAASLLIAIPALFLFKMLLNSFFGPAFATFTTLGQPRMRGVLGALLLGTNNVVGYGVGPVIIGFTSDLFAHGDFAEPLRLAMITVAVTCCLVGSLAYLLAAREMARRAAAASPSAISATS